MGDQTNQNVLVKGMLLGAFVTLILGIIVNRMEYEMINSGKTGFESEGALYGLLVILLATTLFIYLMKILTKNQDSLLKNVNWEILFSVRGIAFYSFIFFVGFFFIPRVFYGFIPPIVIIVIVLIIAYLSTKIFD